VASTDHNTWLVSARRLEDSRLGVGLDRVGLRQPQPEELRAAVELCEV